MRPLADRRMDVGVSSFFSSPMKRLLLELKRTFFADDMDIRYRESGGIEQLLKM
jgi:hypothetical protein